MTMTITIRMDNAAFESPHEGGEAARILRKLAERIEFERVAEFPYKLMDVNGNHVGEVRVR